MHLGIDIGSVSLKLALVGERGEVRYRYYARTRGRPAAAFLTALDQLERETGCRSFAGVVATGSGKQLVARSGGAGATNEILAQARAVARLCPGVRTIIEIGGQDSKLILLDARGELLDHAFNDLCAAGCGAFLDQQAARLGMEVAELGEMAARAKRSVPVASRCAVFAKSDMIHHQQEGAPPEQLAAGLCLALARNYLANLVRGRNLSLPVAFLGGVARNRGVRAAFIELMNLGEKDWVLPEHHDVMGAIGAALAPRDLARPAEPLELSGLRQLMKEVVPKTARLSPLPRGPGAAGPGPAAGDATGGVFLGLDLGSVSTKGVLIDLQDRVVASHYTATAGRPLEALGRVLDALAGQKAEGVKIQGCGVTGSGRMVAAAACRADVVRDEISAQLAASLALDPQADTIFEIGGQDAKMLVVRGGELLDFSLNRICAAGTGSFLAEQADRLGIRIEGEFGERALGSPAPVALGSRCTVFMDSDLIHYQQQGCSTDDLLAGLAYSVAQNFMEHVVEGRPVGRRIWFQGGVAANPAVVAAFESLLQRPIHTHPQHAQTGAWGAALLARKEMELKGGESSFIGFGNYRPESRNRQFTCQHCPNHCEVIQVAVNDGPELSFGGGCDRYEQAGRKEQLRHRTRFVRELTAQFEGVFEDQPEGLPRAMGLPRALWTMVLSPFWVAFFNALGFSVVPSSRSTRQLHRKGLSGVISEHCFGVKLAMGHIRDLIDREVEWIFLPSYAGLPRPDGERECGYKSIACPYVQTLPDIARAGFPRARLLSPRLDLSLGPDQRLVDRLWRDLGERFGVGQEHLAKAVSAGWAAFGRHRARMREIGARALSETKNELSVVLAGHPYQQLDPLLSFSLPVRIAQAGATVIPADILPFQEVSLGREWERVYWRANRDLLRLMEWLDDHPNLLPVLMTAFACGPDAFVSRYLQENRAGRPLLVLELDEHTAEAGLMTRLQAYLANARPRATARQERFRPRPYCSKRTDGRVVYLPRFADHAVAFKAAFLLEGREAQVLPPTSLQALQRGRAWCSGRECNPFAFILGDLLTLVGQPGFEPERACFFIPSTAGPCLLSQFPAGFELVLRGLGVEGLVVDDPRGAEFRRGIRFSTLVRLWEGLVGVEVLSQMLALSRPFERGPNTAEQVHAENLDDLERSMLAGDVAGCLLRSRERLQAVTGPVDRRRPQVAVVGDIFTRINPAANGDLFRRIEALGCVVRAPPMLTDTAWHNAGEAVVFALRRKDRKGALTKALLGMAQAILGRRLQWSRGFGANTGVRFRAWSWWEVERTLEGHLTHDVDCTMAMNVALALEAVRTGADAVINAICHNCMVGMVSDTIFKRLSEEPYASPMVTLTFDGLQETNTTTRLEALCERAHLRKKSTS